MADPAQQATGNLPLRMKLVSPQGAPSPTISSRFPFRYANQARNPHSFFAVSNLAWPHINTAGRNSRATAPNINEHSVHPAQKLALETNTAIVPIQKPCQRSRD